MSTRYLNASKTTRRSPKFFAGRDGNKISGITIHWWDDPSKKPTFDGTVSWLCNPTPEVSAHFVLEDSRIACLVHPRDTAWHARSGNPGTIGIECNPRASQADRDTLVGLIVALWLNYGKVPLYKHNHWVQTDCPGVYGTTYWQQIHDDANRLMLALQHDAARRASYRKAWWDSISSGTGTSFTPGSNITHQTVTVDGYWGSDTTRALQRIMGTPQDGVISSQDVYWKSKNPGLTSGWEWVSNATGSQLIAKLQTRWGASPADGIIGPGTIRAMQKYYGTTVDGTLDEGSSAIMAMQRWINDKLAPAPTPPNTGGNTGSGGSTGGSNTSSLVVDGYWGMDTTRALQKKYGTPQDGVISSQDVYWKSKNPGLTGGWEWVTNATGSQLIARLQKEWGIPNGDGIIGPNTIKAMQRHYKVPQTGTLTENAPAIRKMQEQLRQGTKPSTGGGTGNSSTPKPPKQNGLSDAFAQWVEDVENKYASGYVSIRRDKPAKGEAGIFLIGWLRKPKYWSQLKDGLAWQIYTPEDSTKQGLFGNELKEHRHRLEMICENKNDIRQEIAGEDLAHFAATFLGYYHHGVDSDANKTAISDLGGWALDLLQIWGAYLESKTPDTMEAWIRRHLNIKDDDRGFPRQDVVADADGYLLAKKYWADQTNKKLSVALNELRSKSAYDRVREFYQLRFGSNVKNVQQAFWDLLSGPLGLTLPTIGGPITYVARADRKPNKDEAYRLAKLYADVLNKG